MGVSIHGNPRPPEAACQPSIGTSTESLIVFVSPANSQFKTVNQEFTCLN
jgi:hypothetical protein